MHSSEDLDELFRLSGLHLDEEKARELPERLGKVLAYLRRLEEVEATEEPFPTAEGILLREDAPTGSLPARFLLDNAPEHDGSHFLTPGVLGRRGEGEAE